MTSLRLPSALLLFLTAAVLFSTACSKRHADHAHATDSASSSAAPHTHAHHAPHGGTLLPLGDHLYNLEFVHDPAAGTLTAWVLDAHAENFLRSPLAAINVVIDRNGTPTPLTLAAVANTATGETVGDTSEFSAQADWLKSAAPLRLTIPILIFRDATFRDLSTVLAAPR